MTERKLTDEEVVKALECCITNKCDECDIYKECHNENGKGRVQVVLDLINRQKEQIEELRKGFKADADYFASEYDSYIRAEAIKEFAERLREYYDSYDDYDDIYAHNIRDDIDFLVKEMTEGSNGKS